MNGHIAFPADPDGLVLDGRIGRFRGHRMRVFGTATCSTGAGSGFKCADGPGGQSSTRKHSGPGSAERRESRCNGVNDPRGWAQFNAPDDHSRRTRTDADGDRGKPLRTD